MPIYKFFQCVSSFPRNTRVQDSSLIGTVLDIMFSTPHHHRLHDQACYPRDGVWNGIARMRSVHFTGEFADGYLLKKDFSGNPCSWINEHSENDLLWRYQKPELQKEKGRFLNFDSVCEPFFTYLVSRQMAVLFRAAVRHPHIKLLVDPYASPTSNAHVSDCTSPVLCRGKCPNSNDPGGYDEANAAAKLTEEAKAKPGL
jgi:hypothetical protein